MATTTQTLKIELWLLLLCAALSGVLSYAMGNYDADLIRVVLGAFGLFVLGYLFFLRFRWFVLVFAFLIPLSFPVHFGSNAIDLPSELIVVAMGMMIILKTGLSAWPFRAVLRHPIIILSGLYLTWMLITSMIGVMPMISLKRTVVTGLFVLVFVLYLQEFFQRKENIRHFFTAYGMGMIIPVMISLYNHANFNFNMGAAYAVTKPFFPDHTMYAASLVFVLIFSVGFHLQRTTEHFFMRFVYLGLALLSMTGIYFSFSRAAWLSVLLAVMIGSGLYLKLAVRTWLYFLLIILIIGAMNFNNISDAFERTRAVSSKGNLTEHLQSFTNISNDASNAERLNRWFSALRMFEDRPFFGFGPGTYQFTYGPYQSTEEMTYISTLHGDMGNSHSEFLNVLTETGWPGLLLFLMILMIVVWRGYRLTFSEDRVVRYYAVIALTAIVAYFAHGMVNAFMEVDKVAVLVYGCIAVILSLDLSEKQKKKALDQRVIR